MARCWTVFGKVRSLFAEFIARSWEIVSRFKRQITNSTRWLATFVKASPPWSKKVRFDYWNVDKCICSYYGGLMWAIWEQRAIPHAIPGPNRTKLWEGFGEESLGLGFKKCTELEHVARSFVCRECPKISVYQLLWANNCAWERILTLLDNFISWLKELY